MESSASGPPTSTPVLTAFQSLSTQNAMPSSNLRIRPAVSEDTAFILSMIHELAAYEKLAHEVEATEASMHASLFGERPYAEALIGECDDQPHGFALYFHNFSTFVGKPGLYLEDLYVRPSVRGKGLGKALLIELARIAKARDCGRMEWAVLDWNESAIGFYESLGAEVMSDWRITRVKSDGISRLIANDSV